jgi:hypothetical protein
MSPSLHFRTETEVPQRCVSSYLEYRKMDEVQKPSDSMQKKWNYRGSSTWTVG